MLWSRWRRFTRLFSQATRRRFGPFNAIVVACLGGLGILLAAYGPLYAAVELSSYEVLVLPTAVVVEWQTVSEYDLIGFEVWYKAEDASQSAYKLLGKRVAQGSTQRGVIYRMDVTYALNPNTAYCFQLRELPINGERGEILNRCGYGLGISAQPTPTPTPLFTPTNTVTPTLALTSTTFLTSTPLLTGTTSITAATMLSTTTLLTSTQPFTQPFTQPLTQPLTTTVGPFPTSLGPTTTLPTDTLPVSPSNPGETSGFVFPTATPTPFNLSVLPTPLTSTQALPATTTMATGTFAAASVNAPTDLFSQTAALTGTTISGSQSPFESALPTPLATVSISLTPTTTVAVAAPNPPYIVLTATPTTLAAASAPTFTPYPTLAAPAGETLLGVQVPDTQNLMIMLLCGVFSGASGLGILGLVSTLLYIRARAANRQNRPSQR